MTTTQTIKNELLSNLTTLQPCCKVAFLSAVFRSAGSLLINSDGFGVSVSGENLELMQLVSRTVEEMFGVICPVKTSYNPIKNNDIYSVLVKDVTVLRETSILAKKDGFTGIVGDIDPYLFADECCVKNFLIGLFVGCGTVTFPLNNDGQKITGYHIEFFVSSPVVANSLIDLLKQKGLHFKTAPRADGTVVYAKDSATISDFLAYLGANKAVLELQTLLIERECINNANRQSNCITANIGKSVNASEKQIADIEYVIKHKGWEYFSENLKTIAKIRMENPSANLTELATMCGDQLTKSGVAHRLRKIALLAKKLGKKD